MAGFVKFCWAVTATSASFGGLYFFVTLTLANGAPQEASGAAGALAFAIIPYVFTRAIAGLAAPAVQSVRLIRDNPPMIPVVTTAPAE